MGLFTTFLPAAAAANSATPSSQTKIKKHRSKKKSSSSTTSSTAAAARPSTPLNRTPTPTKQRKSPTSSKQQQQQHNQKQTKRKQKPSPSPLNQIIKPAAEKEKRHQQQQQQPAAPLTTSSWDQFKNLLTCKQIEGSRVHDPSKSIYPANSTSKYNNTAINKLQNLGRGGGSSSCGSMCSFRDVVHGNTRVVHRSNSNSPESSSLGQDTRLLNRKSNPHVSSSSRSLRSAAAAGTGTGGVSYRGMPPLRKLSGCYECHMIVDPSRYPIIPRAAVCACPQCGEIFPKVESLEHHQAVKHAVSELGPEDSGRNIVEIIFKSSWMKKDSPIYKIERILKVQNTPRTIQRFEDCRDAVKTRANTGGRKNPRCAADGNELLRFHCTSLACALGARGSSSLCGSVPACGVCTIIRHGFHDNKGGVTTTASSGRAHDSLKDDTAITTATTGGSNRRAMLVCRVIAGRVKHNSTNNNEDEENDNNNNGQDDQGSITSLSSSPCDYDSVVAGSVGVYSSLEELSVFNPKAILPCFVVIYRTLLDNHLN